MRNMGYAVFCDLKLHDIPTTVHRAARVLGALGTDYVNLHASGGDAQISGRVSPNGAVFVRVVSANGNAAGSGRLRGNTGGGSFRGHSSQGACAGTWSGQRTGG